MCNFHKEGMCRLGSKCMFAHSRAELREPFIPNGFCIAFITKVRLDRGEPMRLRWSQTLEWHVVRCGQVWHIVELKRSGLSSNQ